MKTIITNGTGSIVISTVKLNEIVQALDSMFGFPGAGWRFETLVFRGDALGVHDYGEIDAARYATAEEALRGHDAMVAKWIGDKAVNTIVEWSIH